MEPRCWGRVWPGSDLERIPDRTLPLFTASEHARAFVDRGSELVVSLGELEGGGLPPAGLGVLGREVLSSECRCYIGYGATAAPESCGLSARLGL